MIDDIAKVCLVSIIIFGITVVAGTIAQNNARHKTDPQIVASVTTTTTTTEDDSGHSDNEIIKTDPQIVASVTTTTTKDDSDHSDNEIIKTDNIKNIQPGGCKTPLVLSTSGGLYIIPLANISAINIYENTSNINILLIYLTNQKLVFEITGKNGLSTVNNLVNKICYN
jgi:hypothetical protein